MKTSFRNEGKIKTFSDEGNRKIPFPPDLVYKNVKGSSLGWREMIPEGKKHRSSSMKEAQFIESKIF